MYRVFNYLILLVGLLIYSNYAIGQNDYKWGKAEKTNTKIPNIYLNADAVITKHYEERQTLYENPYFLTRTIIKKRIKILTTNGLEKYARIVIPKKKDLHISILDARTFKKNGTIVELNSKDIKSIDSSTDDKQFSTQQYLLFAVPGIEIGDEFEMIVIYKGRVIETGENVYLHHTLPILESEFVLDVNKDIIVHTSNYNKMPEPTVQRKLNSHQFRWKLENLKGLYDQRGAILANEIPYFIYELKLDRFYKESPPPTVVNWRDLLLDINENKLDIIIRKRKKWNEIFNKIIGTSSTVSDQIKSIHQYINKHIDIVSSIPSNEQGNGIEFFFEKHKADYFSLLKMYKSLFEELEIDYYLASARSRYLGSINLNFPSVIQISDYLFVIEDKEGTPILLMPKTDQRNFMINEIPPQLEGSSLYMINIKNKTTFKEIKIPYSSYKKNKRNRKTTSKIDLEKKIINHSCIENFTGAVSTEIRHIYNHANHLNKLEQLVLNLLKLRNIKTRIHKTNIIEQTPIKTTDFAIQYDYELTNSINKIDKNIYTINIGNWFPHVLYSVDTTHRQLDYYPIFMSMDICSYYLEFDHDIKLINKEQLNLSISNHVGDFEIKVVQVKSNMLAIRSKYVIKKSKIQVAKIVDLINLNIAAKKLNNNNSIIIERIDSIAK